MPAYGQPAATGLPEAQKTAQQMWEKLLAKCDDSYYFNTSLDNKSFHVIQYKTPSFDVRSLPLSQADKLNGAAWMGYAVLLAPAYRVFQWSDDGSLKLWRPWHDGTHLKKLARTPSMGNNSGMNIVAMAKREGTWSFVIPADPERALDLWDGDFNLHDAWMKPGPAAQKTPAANGVPSIPVTPDDVAQHKLSCEAAKTANGNGAAK
jgi:hypothetical protein